MTRKQTKEEEKVQKNITKIMTDLQEWMGEHFLELEIPSKVALMGAFSELSQNTTDHVVKLLLSLDKEVREDEEKLSSEDFAKVKAYAESLHRKKQGKKEN